MKKLLLGDASEAVLQVLSKQMKSEFDICKCTDGTQVLKAVQNVKPDILVLDLHLPQISGLDVLRTIRSSGNLAEVIVTGFLMNDHICAELTQLQVAYFLPKPYSVGAIVSQVRDLSTKMQLGEFSVQAPERVANYILLNLGFRMGLNRYQCVLQALMQKYCGEDGAITKCLYPKVARVCGGNVAQVEKAIRDAIKDAWLHGNREIWQMYFPFAKDAAGACPSNEVFLARIVYAMQECLGHSGNDSRNIFQNIS